MEAGMARARVIVFLVFDGVKMLDVTGPAEVFAEANRFGADYRLRYASPSGQVVTTSIGTTFAVGLAADDVGVDDGDGTSGRVDTVVIPGSDDLPTKPIPAELLAAVASLRERGDRLVSICTGSFVLAAAGLLDGRRATTHWRVASLLARAFPEVSVAPDALFVHDRGIYTSAGVSAGIDLALSLVEADHGPDLAREVARNLVMFMQRPGGQSQFAAPLQIRAPRTPTLRAVVDLVSSQPALDHSITSLAAHAGVSPRHLARLFAAELDVSPAKFVERTRLDYAQSMLDAGHGVTETARLAGFGSPETMRRLFVARFGVPPSQYRARFKTTASPHGAVRGADDSGNEPQPLFGPRIVLDEVDEVRALEPMVEVGEHVVVHRAEGGVGPVGHALVEGVQDLPLEVRAGVRRHNRLLVGVADLVEVEAEHVGLDPEGDHPDFRGEQQRNLGCGVQRDGEPYVPRLLLGTAVVPQESVCRLGAVDLEALAGLAERLGQAHVVEHAADVG
jgi:transcriptional regulator GlxA family with amidase domain